MQDHHLQLIFQQLQAIAAKPTGSTATQKLARAVDELTIEVRALREQLAAARPAAASNTYQ